MCEFTNMHTEDQQWRSQMCNQMPHQDGSSKEAVGLGFLSVLWKQVPFCSYFRGAPPFWSPVPPTGGSGQCQDSSLSTWLPLSIPSSLCFFRGTHKERAQLVTPPGKGLWESRGEKIPIFFPFPFSLSFFLFLYKNNQNTCNTLVKGSEREKIATEEIFCPCQTASPELSVL